MIRKFSSPGSAFATLAHTKYNNPSVQSSLYRSSARPPALGLDLHKPNEQAAMMNMSKTMAESRGECSESAFYEDEGLLYTYTATNQGRPMSVTVQEGAELRPLLAALRVVTPVKLYKPQGTRPEEKTSYRISVRTNDLPQKPLTAC